MRTKKEIKEQITKIKESYKGVLDCGPASVGVNAPRALMQLSAIVQLDTLYWIIDVKRPQFKCDNMEEVDR